MEACICILLGLVGYKVFRDYYKTYHWYFSRLENTWSNIPYNESYTYCGLFTKKYIQNKARENNQIFTFKS